MIDYEDLKHPNSNRKKNQENSSDRSNQNMNTTDLSHMPSMQRAATGTISHMQSGAFGVYGSWIAKKKLKEKHKILKAEQELNKWTSLNLN